MTAGNGHFRNRVKKFFLMIILIMSAVMLTACGGAGTQTEKTGTESSGAAESGAESSEAGKSGVENLGAEKTESEKSEAAESGSEKSEEEKTGAESSEAENSGIAGSETAKPAKETAEAAETVKPVNRSNTDPDIILGDERADIYLPMLDGKRVALFTNQTGIVGNQIETDTDSEAELAREDENADTGR